MGKTIRASALILLLAGSAHAGYIPYGSPQPPPPQPPPESVQAQDTDGETDTGLTDIFLDVALNLLAGAGSIF